MRDFQLVQDKQRNASMLVYVLRSSMLINLKSLSPVLV